MHFRGGTGVSKETLRVQGVTPSDTQLTTLTGPVIRDQHCALREPSAGRKLPVTTGTARELRNAVLEIKLKT